VIYLSEGKTMSNFTVPPEFVALLTQLKQPTEFRDSQGTVLGVFTPKAESEEERFERIKALFDLEEAERILATERDSGRPLKEFWRDIKGQRASE
jgi:hypothetical protein